MSKSLETKYTLNVGSSDAERLEFQNSLMRKATNRVFSLALEMKNLDDAVVLDFGCGTSSAYQDIANNINNISYIGVDASPLQIDFSKESFPNNRYVCGTENDLDVINAIKSADIIFMRFVLMHQREQKEFLSKIFNYMQPGALLMIEEPESQTPEEAKLPSEYRHAKNLYDDLKISILRACGADYNFAKNLESTLKDLAPAKILYELIPCHSTISQAKYLYSQTVKSIADKPLESGFILQKDIDECLRAINDLPDSDQEQWPLDSMHLAVAMK